MRARFRHVFRFGGPYLLSCVARVLLLACQRKLRVGEARQRTVAYCAIRLPAGRIVPRLRLSWPQLLDPLNGSSSIPISAIRYVRGKAVFIWQQEIR
jgi:hypothetical protein